MSQQLIGSHTSVGFSDALRYFNSILTSVDNALDVNSSLFGHVAEDREDDESGVETRGAVDQWYNDREPKYSKLDLSQILGCDNDICHEYQDAACRLDS